APVASRRFATRSGKAKATQAPVSPRPRAGGETIERQRRARPRAASARRPFSPRQRRRRSSRSASLPPSPRSDSRTAISAALSPQPRPFASISIWARRGGGGGIEPAQGARIGDAPDRAIEQQSGKVRLEDFGRVEAGQAPGRRFLPQ